MTKEKPDPKDMYTFARIVHDLQKRKFTEQEAIEIDAGLVALKTADLIDRCAFCVAIRYDTQPPFVELIIRHFDDKHLVAEK